MRLVNYQIVTGLPTGEGYTQYIPVSAPTPVSPVVTIPVS